MEEVKQGRNGLRVVRATIAAVERRRESVGFIWVVQSEAALADPYATFEAIRQVGGGHGLETSRQTVQWNGSRVGEALHLATTARSQGGRGPFTFELLVTLFPDRAFRAFLQWIAGSLETGTKVRGTRAASKLLANSWPIDFAEAQLDPDHDASDARQQILEQLQTIDDKIRDWYRRFQEGAPFSFQDRGDQEETMRILVERLAPATASDGELAGRRVGLEARLSRLFNALSQRDAAGPTQQLLAVLTALVLVPTLVAGVYGANVEGPLTGTRAGFLAMLAFMASGAAVTYAALTSMIYDHEIGRAKLAQLWDWGEAAKARPSPSLSRVALLSFGLGCALVALDANGGLEPKAGTTHAALVMAAFTQVWFLTYEMHLPFREAQNDGQGDPATTNGIEAGAASGLVTRIAAVLKPICWAAAAGVLPQVLIVGL